MTKRILSLVLAVLTALSLCTPAFASGEPAADILAIETPAADVPVTEDAAEPGITPESAATAEPEAVPGPEAEAEPEITAEPEATAEPVDTVEPEAATEPVDTPESEPADQPEEAESGLAGGLTWEFSGGVLTISGNGAMPDYGEPSKRPWNSYGSAIAVVVIQNGVTNIGSCAFYGCSGLASITIPASVKSVGPSAFSGCGALSSVTLPDSVVSIGESAFHGCSTLANVDLSASLLTIGKQAFYGCSGLTTLTCPSTLVSIGDEAFWGCSRLASITLSGKLTSIGEKAFYNCSTLSSLSVPSSVRSIGASAFYGCKNLSSIGLSEGLTSIGASAFEGCSTLASITVPASVTSIGESVFDGCSGLKSINVASGNKVYSSVDGILYNADKTTLIRCPEGKAGLVDIPNGTDLIIKGSFERCRQVSVLRIPNSITNFEDFTFYDCGLQTLYVENASCALGTSIGFVFGGGYVYGHPGSTAEEYTKKHGCTFAPIGLPAPKLTVTAAAGGGIKLTWGAVDGAVKYRILYKTGSGGWSKLLDTDAAEYTWKEAKSSTSYTFTVQCYTMDGSFPTGEFDNTGKTIKYTAPAVKNGLVTEGGRTYFYKDGVKQTGFVTSGGKTYYCDTTDGHVVKGGVKKVGQSFYFFAADGHMLSGGWIAVGGKNKYYAGKDGGLYVGYMNIGNRSYYFSVKDAHLMKGGLVTGPGNKQYYVSANDGHAMKGGWARGEAVKTRPGYSKYYFLDESGRMRVTRVLPTSTRVGSLAIPKPSEYQN